MTVLKSQQADGRKLIVVNQPVIAISFSGIDGAGKSTQIDALCANIVRAGARVARLSFWDDVVMLSDWRDALSHRLLKGEKGVGTPERPVARRDKNVRSWYLNAVRPFLYLLDAVHLRFVLRSKLRCEIDAIVFDRYIYDELANLRLGNKLMRAYARLLLRLAPTPDIAYLLDADPVVASWRKPEYPLDFLHANRDAYLALSHLAGGMKVIGPGAIVEVRDRIVEELLRLPARKLECPSFVKVLACSQIAKSQLQAI